jgi:hypothetical protein
MSKRFSSHFRDLLSKHSELNELMKHYSRKAFEMCDKAQEYTFLVPSKEMVQEIRQMRAKNDIAGIQKKLLALCVPQKLSKTSDWGRGVRATGNINLQVKNTNNKNVTFANGATASHVTNKDNIAVWQLHGDHIPDGDMRVVTGKFENVPEPETPQNDEELTKLAKIVRKTAREPDGFKTMVAVLYMSLDSEDKETAKQFINGNPAAEFFFLYDSPFVKCNKKVLLESSANPGAYDDICTKTPKLYNIEHIREIKNMITQESNFARNLYKEFYENVSRNKGVYKSDDKEYRICNEVIAPYLYSMEMFCYAACMIHKQMSTTDDQIFNHLFDQLIILNTSTNMPSEQQILFKMMDPLTSFEMFEERFNKFGFCLFKTEIAGSGEKKKKHKPKPRKYLDVKNKLKKLDITAKQKLLKMLSK